MKLCLARQPASNCRNEQTDLHCHDSRTKLLMPGRRTPTRVTIPFATKQSAPVTKSFLKAMIQSILSFQDRTAGSNLRLRYDIFGHDVVLYALWHRKEAY